VGEKNIPTQLFLLTTVFHCCSKKERGKENQDIKTRENFYKDD